MLTGILGLLHPEDRVSITLFSDTACTPLPLGTVNCLDLGAVKTSIQARKPGMELGRAVGEC